MTAGIGGMGATGMEGMRGTGWRLRLAGGSGPYPSGLMGGGMEFVDMITALLHPP